MKTVIGLLVSLLTLASCQMKSKSTEEVEAQRDDGVQQVDGAKRANITIERKNGLIVYYPNYSSIDLACATMPEPTDESILFCCAAAFTGELLKEFTHTNIAGNHVSNGEFYEGYSCKDNTGCFAYYKDDGSWKFAMGEYDQYVADAEKRGGMAFGQVMLVYNGVRQTKFPHKATTKNYYRTLAEYQGKLCIIDTEESVAHKEFVDAIHALGVTHAIYMDMGTGWNYSYYRDNQGEVSYIHDVRGKYTTNWITFKK